MKTFWLSTFCAVMMALPVIGQAQTRLAAADWERMEAWEDTLGLLSYAFVNDSSEENRFFAVRAFIPKLVNALKTPGSFDYPFEQLRTVSIQYPADSTFRIFTWQLYVDKDNYRYYGAIQMNNSDLQLFPLVDRSFNFNGDYTTAIFGKDDWFGALYYNIHAVTQGNQTYYLLFGFDGYQFFRKRKLVDVLTFQEGKPVFGAPVFVNDSPNGKTVQSRLLLEYSATASVRCNYDPALELLIFDHLTEIGGPHGEGPVNIPDGTYEAYQLGPDGYWHYIEKVFHETLDEAPRPAPLFDGKRKDLLGNGGRR
ncbi:MAG: hypothetical protein R2795_20185 [Saprospiraceae bacterium]